MARRQLIHVTNKIIFICTSGFILAALLVAADEIFDIPALIFNALPTPVNWTEIGIEILLIFIVGAFTILYISKLVLERKQAEEALKEKEVEYRQLFQTIPSGVAVYEAVDGGDDFICKDFNQAGERIEGVRRKDIIGKHVTEAFPGIKEFGVFEVFQRVWRTGKAEYFPTAIYRDKRDPSTWRENWVCKLPSGEIVAVYNDITERKRAEEALQESEEHLRSIMDSMQAGVFIVDAETRTIVDIKPYAIRQIGAPREKIIGRRCHKFICTSEEGKCPVLDLGQSIDNSERELVDINGQSIPVLKSVIPITLGGRKCLLDSFIDISERKRMEEQLIITDRLASIGELASGIAHELNNPLTSVIGFADLLIGKEVPDDIKGDLEVINTEAKRAAEVVKNLLTFARKHPQEKHPVNINNLIEKVRELRAYEHKVNNIQVNTKFAPDLPEITADGFQLQQVFLNIIINAEHFMIETHGRGTLTITTERVDGIIRASFADDGPGIASENLNRLFDPFFTTKEVGKGTGLGLSISHGIVTTHGGNIYAKGKLGKGATFVVELPISKH